MRAADISLIISTYDRPTALDKVLLGVQLQTEAPGEILLADDASGPPTAELVEAWSPQFKVPLRLFRQEDAAPGKTTILNQCLAAAKGSYIVLLDGDCVPHAQFIADHVKVAEKGYWVQGRRCYVKQRQSRHFSIDTTPILRWMYKGLITGWSKGIRLPFPLIRRDTGTDGILGSNMAFWREDAIAINGFDEEYIGWGHEDSDFGVRLYHLGRQRKCVRGHAIIYHLNHPWVDRQRAESSRQRLTEVIQSRKVRCERGLDQYLTANPGRP